MGVTVKVYKDLAGEWRWTASNSGNHEPMSTSSEGYVHRVDCLAAAMEVNPADATYIEA